LQAVPVPDEARTNAALDAILSGGRSTSRRSWPLVAAAAVVALLLVVVPFVLQARLGDDRPDPAPAPRDGLTGSWSRTAEVSQQPSWSGRWTIAFGDGGVLTMIPPPDADEAGDGVSYVEEGRQVRLDAFVNGACADLPPGRYAWEVSTGTLRLTVVDDACEVRASVFAATWRNAG
jgi:hypothetical protein